MENSVTSPPMEVRASPQGDPTVNSKNTLNDDIRPNEPEKKMNMPNKRRRTLNRNKFKRVVDIKRKYLLLRNNVNKNYQLKEGVVLSPLLTNKMDITQLRRRGRLVKKVHLQRNGIDISFDMTESEQKMLEFYKVKLSVLKSENENLHKQLESLTKENMRLLQIKPILSSA